MIIRAEIFGSKEISGVGKVCGLRHFAAAEVMGGRNVKIVLEEI